MAWIVVFTFLWTFLLAPPTLAVAISAAQCNIAGIQQRFPNLRVLGRREMARLWGKSSPQPSLQLMGLDGSAYPWQNEVLGVNTANGNKLTTISIVGWKARGGLSVDFTLYHNSLSTTSGELGPKWSHSYDISLSFDSTGNATVTWGDGKSYTFTKNINGTYSPPAGIYETLVANGSPITSYTLTTHGQVAYTFTNPNGTAWVATSYADPNGNTITINRNSANQVTSVVDPSGRKLTLAYNANAQLASVTDPLGRTWTFSYSSSSGGGSGGGGGIQSISPHAPKGGGFHVLTTSGGTSQLTSISWPTLNNTTYSLQLAYNSSNDITTLTDLRGNKWGFSYNSNNTIATQTDPLGQYHHLHLPLFHPNQHHGPQWAHQHRHLRQLRPPHLSHRPHRRRHPVRLGRL